MKRKKVTVTCMHEKCTVDGEEKYNLILQVDSQGSPNF